MLTESNQRTKPDEGLGLPTPPAGFDPLIAGKYRTSGLLPTFKAPPKSLKAFIYTSRVERTLALWHELNPACTVYGRVDVSKAGAARLGIKAVPGFDLCYPIQYAWDGKIHFYLPDVGSQWEDGPSLAEAGRLEGKSGDQSRAAFAATRALLDTVHGTFRLLLEGQISRRWEMRALTLHLWRFAYYGKEGLLADVDASWRAKRSARSLIREFAGRGSPSIVQHAVMKVAGEALAAGRFDHDLSNEFDLDTKVRLLA